MARAHELSPSAPCPCGSGLTFQLCCLPLHRGTAAPATAESVMRARYSAFAVGNSAYLQSSWHPDTRETDMVAPEGVTWLTLEVVRTTAGGESDDIGTVEFIAKYRADNELGEVHEVSKFVRHDGQWVYRSGRDVSMFDAD